MEVVWHEYELHALRSYGMAAAAALARRCHNRPRARTHSVGITCETRGDNHRSIRLFRTRDHAAGCGPGCVHLDVYSATLSQHRTSHRQGMTLAPQLQLAANFGITHTHHRELGMTLLRRLHASQTAPSVALRAARRPQVPLTVKVIFHLYGVHFSRSEAPQATQLASPIFRWPASLSTFHAYTPRVVSARVLLIDTGKHRALYSVEQPAKRLKPA
jgi:hypothetical protein